MESACNGRLTADFPSCFPSFCVIHNDLAVSGSLEEVAAEEGVYEEIGGMGSMSMILVTEVLKMEKIFPSATGSFQEVEEGFKRPLVKDLGLLKLL